MYYITRTHVNPLINLVKIQQVSNILPRLPLFTLGYPLFVLYVHVYPYIIHVPQRLLVYPYLSTSLSVCLFLFISIHVLQRLIVLTLIYLHFTRLLFTRS